MGCYSITQSMRESYLIHRARDKNKLKRINKEKNSGISVQKITCKFNRLSLKSFIQLRGEVPTIEVTAR